MSLSRRRSSGAKWLGAFLVAYVALGLLRRGHYALYHAWWERADTGWLGAHVNAMTFVMRASSEALAIASFLLGAGTVVALVVALARILRRRPRADALPSRWSVVGLSQRYPTLMHRVLPAVFGGVWFLARTDDFRLSDALEGEAFQLNANLIAYVVGGIAAAVATAIASRFAVRAIDRAPETPAEAPATNDDRPLDDATFTAVAVTATTRGAVAALALASVAMAVFAVVAPARSMGAPVITYVLAALGAATLFRYVSRIVVGIDGILVTGMGRTRVFGYAMFDDVRESGSDIVLTRANRVLVRLQLPVDEEPRLPALVAKLRDAMARAASLRNGGADIAMQMAKAENASSESLGAASTGGGHYRRPAIAREQLWELIEGPLADAESRTVAAEALAPALAPQERTRLRIAANQSADPKVRIRLLDLAAEDEHPEDAATNAQVAARLRSNNT